MPRQPPAAQVRCGQCRAARSIARYPDASVPYRPPPSTVSSLAMTSIVGQLGRKQIPA
jgi:hypothetical protein